MTHSPFIFKLKMNKRNLNQIRCGKPLKGGLSYVDHLLQLADPSKKIIRSVKSVAFPFPNDVIVDF